MSGRAELSSTEASSTGPDGGRSARNSVVVAALTSTSRVSGVVRIMAVGAVLGPTHLGDAYQVTNTLPTLVWYGFLAGSVVPARKPYQTRFGSVFVTSSGTASSPAPWCQPSSSRC